MAVVTSRVTISDVRANRVIPLAGRRLAMSHCEFCETPLGTADPENVALLGHVEASTECGRQYEFLLENLRSSWTSNMSGG